MRVPPAVPARYLWGAKVKVSRTRHTVELKGKGLEKVAVYRVVRPTKNGATHEPAGWLHFFNGRPISEESYYLLDEHTEKDGE